MPSDSSYDSSVHLSFGDVAVDDPSVPSMLSIHLKASKPIDFAKAWMCLLVAPSKSFAQCQQYWHIWQSEVQSLAHYFSSRMVVFSQETD